MRVGSLAFACAAATLAATTLAGQATETDEILARAERYVAEFFDRFSNVVAEERYAQDLISNRASLAAVRSGGRIGPQPTARHRDLKADFLLVKPSESTGWQPFRDVFEVDGDRVRDRERRIEKLFLEPSKTTVDSATAIANESARYNLGNMQRTINNPIIALMFLTAHNQPRFRFDLDKLDPAAGTDVWIVEYQEREKPTLILGAGRDIFARGRYWIHRPTGRVVKTELLLNDPSVTARLEMRFQFDNRFQIDVPIEMREEYVLGNTQLSGRATYGRFRRFGVSTDEAIHTPPVDTITEPRTKITLIEVPAGRFTMGSAATEVGRNLDETEHDVTLNRAFFLGEHEVTQQEWQALMGATPSHATSCGPRCPVENVTFDDVQRFVAALNARGAAGLVYRLPTEAEWEYACRAGTITPFATGENITTAQANYDGSQPYSAFLPGVPRERPTRAGEFSPNQWGLADMHGNVWEWTADWYSAYPSGEVADPLGPSTGERRVIRGGSYRAGAASARCAARATQAADARDSALGFRVAADAVTPVR